MASLYALCVEQLGKELADEASFLFGLPGLVPGLFKDEKVQEDVWNAANRAMSGKRERSVEFARAFFGMGTLTVLVLDGVHDTNASELTRDHFPALRDLEVTSASRAAFSDSAIRRASILPDLTRIAITSSLEMRAHWPVLLQAVSPDLLEELVLNHASFSPTLAAPESKLPLVAVLPPSLRTLHMHGNQIPEANWCQSLLRSPGLNQLHTLHLTFNDDVDDQVAFWCSNLPSLINVDLSRTSITELAIVSLIIGRGPFLEHVNVSHCGRIDLPQLFFVFGQRSTDEVFMERFERLRYLNLSGLGGDIPSRALNASDLFGMWDALHAISSPQLETVVLQHMRMCDHDSRAIFAAQRFLRERPGLNLDLSHNRVSDKLLSPVPIPALGYFELASLTLASTEFQFNHGLLLRSRFASLHTLILDGCRELRNGFAYVVGDQDEDAIFLPNLAHASFRGCGARVCNDDVNRVRAFRPSLRSVNVEGCDCAVSPFIRLVHGGLGANPGVRIIPYEDDLARLLPTDGRESNGSLGDEEDEDEIDHAVLRRFVKSVRRLNGDVTMATSASDEENGFADNNYGDEDDNAYANDARSIGGNSAQVLAARQALRRSLYYEVCCKCEACGMAHRSEFPADKIRYTKAQLLSLRGSRE